MNSSYHFKSLEYVISFNQTPRRLLLATLVSLTKRKRTETFQNVLEDSTEDFFNFLYSFYYITFTYIFMVYG